MSNTKHLADLLKVCSILPALVILPAMAAEYTSADIEKYPYTVKAGDSLVVTDGYSNAENGVFTNNGSLIINDGLVFADNNTGGYGATVYIFNKNATYTKIGNNVVFSGGTAMEGSSPDYEGMGGAIYTWSDGDASGANVIEMGDNVVFRGNSAAEGSVMYTYGYNEITIGDNLVVENNSSPYGYGAIVLNGYDAFNGKDFVNTMNVGKNALFQNNTALLRSGAVYIGGDANDKAIFDDGARFIGNSSSFGGAVSGFGAFEFGDVSFVSNVSYNAWEQTLKDAGWSTSYNGHVGNGGAVLNRGDFVIKGNADFLDNQADGYGGAIYNGGQMTIANAEFEDNIAKGYYGGAVYNAAAGNITKLVAEFEENKVVNADYAMGGAIANIGKIGKLSGVFEENVAHATKDDAHTSTKGGAIYTYSSSVIDSLTADFVGNVAISAGEAMGGAIVNDGKITKLHQTGQGFVNNTANAVTNGWAGALYNSQGASIGELVANFTGNSAKGTDWAIGGALVNQGTIEALSGVFANNFVTATGQDGVAIGGAIYNSGTLNFVGDSVFSNNTANGGRNDIYNEGVINISDGTVKLDGGIIGDGTGTLNIAEGATLNIGTTLVEQETIDLQGTLVASLLNDSARGGSYGRLIGDITVGANAMFELNVGAVGIYNVWGDTDVDLSKVSVGDIYEIADVDADGIHIVTKSADDIAEATGISTQAASVVAGLANANNGKAYQVSLALQDALNAGDAEVVEVETKKLNPTDKPVAQAAATSMQNQILSLAAGRMASGVSVGRAGGDEIPQENGFWMQGLFNKSKFADKFHGYTRGVALGADTTIDKIWTIGGGLAVNNSDVHAGARHTDIDSKTLFLYGQYKPNNWFVNLTATYNMAEYTENVNMIGGVALTNMYDVESEGAQIVTGYDFATGITTEAGLRYLHISQDGYTPEFGPEVKAQNTDFLSGVAGLKYAFAIENDWAIQLRPELRAAMTYDFISDDAQSTVVMPGGTSYKVSGERLSRMGGEFGIGLTALYNGMELSVMYDLDLHEDYTSQTGMIKFRAQF
ncbi:MAG: autotransporter domain-containing protein [Alphaproteobacteria bacterium]|nr:autotransporter domain-containing protein [Alphaproteobacteria bacterium]